MSGREPSGDGALDRLAELARAAEPPPSPAAAADPAYHRVRAALRGPRRRWWLVPAALAGGLVAGAFYLWRGPALEYTVEGGAIAEGGYLRAPAAAEAAVRFSDGTEVRLEPRSRGRIAWTGARGARVLLEHGRAQVKVVPRPGRQWQFDAGPCLVQVTGTRFDLRWSEAEQVLELGLTSGSVIVRGPPAPSGVAVRAGQRLVMDVRQSFARLSPLVATPPAPEAPVLPSEPPPPPEQAPLVETAPPRPGRRPPAPAPSWSERVLAGEFSAVLREARHRGLDEVLRRDGPADLMALAEAARFSAVPALARRALTTVRTRFPASGQASKAAFLLGRLAEDGDGDLGNALDWYGRYLAEAPAGAFRDEALGRKMTATLSLRGHGPARPLAEEYLRRFPAGSYATPARAILAAPP